VKPKTLLLVIAGAWIALMAPGTADTAHFWQVFSPDHEQTYAYGTETNRFWKLWRGHLALFLEFSNDPAVDRNNPRQYDNFRFDFPTIRIGANGDTLYLHTEDGRRIPVASLWHDFFGFEEVRLLPNANVIVDRPHGYITVHLDVLDPGGLATLR
jgi:hypothetical protein